MRGMDYLNEPPVEKAIAQDPAWYTLTREYPYLKDGDLTAFCSELDSFLETAREMVGSIYH